MNAIRAKIALSAIVISLQVSAAIGSFGFYGRHAEPVASLALQTAELRFLSRAVQDSVIVTESHDIALKKDNTLKDSSKTSFIAFPILYRTPETRWAFGAAASLRFSLAPDDEDTPDSQLQLGGAYTQEKQLLIYMPFQFYTRARLWAFTGEFGYYDYSYFFYGIGDHIDPAGERYDIDYPRLRIAAVRKLSSNLYAGLRYSFDQLDISIREPEGLFSEGIVGSSGGVISGLGPILEYDSRDHVYQTTSGSFIRLRYDIHRSTFGSDYAFNRFHADLRYFITLQETTIGFQVFYEGNSADVPFTQMALLGGGLRMRGYYEGYYRDRSAYSAQTEVRRSVYKRFGAVAFLAVGETFSISPDLINMRWAGGMGLRYLLDVERRVSLRADYGLGESGVSGFYLTIGEAF